MSSKGRQILVVVILLVISATAIGAGGRAAGWWDRSEAAPDEEVLKKAFAQRSLDRDVDMTRARAVARSGGVVLVAVPRNDGGYCLAPTIGREDDLSIVCDEGSSAETRSVFVSWTIKRPGANAVWVIAGRVTDPGASNLSLAGLSLDLQEGGFFLGSIPENRWGDLDLASVPVEIRRADLEVIRETCVTMGDSPYAPRFSTEKGVSAAASTLKDPPC